MKKKNMTGLIMTCAILGQDLCAKAVSPKDILPDGDSYISLNGVKARKGSVAAFLKNIEIIENKNASAEEKENAIQAMKDLAPVLIALNMHKHVSFHNPIAQKIINDSIDN